jgi:hypothetical protein
MHRATQSVVSLGLTGLLLLNTGCASIVSGTNKKVNVVTNPEGAKFTVVDEKGKVVAEGVTPQIVKLKTGKAYFASKRYTLTFDLQGHQAATARLNSTFNGWYVGNLLFGGLLGLLIVDPLSGAVYTLQKEVVVDLAKSVTLNAEPGELHVLDISQIPEPLRPRLIRVN